MTWPNLNWELIEAFAYIFGAIGFAIVVNRVGKWLGLKGHGGSPSVGGRSSDCRIDNTNINPATGYVMVDEVDTQGHIFGSGDRD